ncbi:MAG: 16S rRNA (cytidine(1402)-2'-O)-methyltransferase [bacterium]|nr:16S rRNA (cytidine(1402)-2'-O)-methyltransferase [bacterium]
MNGILYLVGTPIGNLQDITLRALTILKEVDLVIAEDTRSAKRLLSHFEINKPVRRYDDYAGVGVYEKIKKELMDGAKIALVTDAGMPIIADPGAKLISYLKKESPKIKIEVIPGPTALTTALTGLGFNASHFTFIGYPPHQKGRVKFFSQLKDVEARPVVLYESPYRFQKTLTALLEVFGSNQEIGVAREMTKIYEEYWRGTIEEAKEYFVSEKLKGEFVLIIS